MKKHPILMFCILLMCLIGLVGVGLTIEGTKTLTFPDKTTVEVPELCPDFLNFMGEIVGALEYPNGNSFLVVALYNEDRSVLIMMAMAQVDGVVGVIGLQVKYVRTGMVDGYEDLGFMKTGKFSHKLSRVDQLTEYDAFVNFLNKLEI